MTISVPCSCGHILEVRAEKMNRRVVCPVCRQAFWATRPSSSPSMSSSQSPPVVAPRPQVQPPPLPSTATGFPPVESLSAPRPLAAIATPGLLGWLNHHRPILAIGVFVAAFVLALGAIAGFRQVGEPRARQIADARNESADDASVPSGGGGMAPGGEPGPTVTIPPGLLNPPAAENVPDRSRPAPAPSLGSPAKTLTTQEIVARCEASVALVKGRSGSGTGFIVRPGIIATNAHVIAHEPSRALQIYFPSAPEKDRGPLPARLRYKDARRDLALLAVQTTLSPLELSRTHVFQRGEDITIIGSPGLGGGQVLPNAVTRGVMSTEYQLQGHRYYQLSAAVNPGNSGGPAFNASGLVIGVVTAKAAQLESIGLCIPVEDLIRAIDKDTQAGPDAVVKIEHMHDAQAVVERLGLIGKLNSDAADSYIAAFNQAAMLGGAPEMAISAQKRVIMERLAPANRALTADLPDEIEALRAAADLSMQVRRDVSELWDEFTGLRSWVENPHGPVANILAALRRAKARFGERLTRVQQVLGIEPERR
jgi:S1-C subfamily serine protease